MKKFILSGLAVLFIASLSAAEPDFKIVNGGKKLDAKAFNLIGEEPKPIVKEEPVVQTPVVVTTPVVISAWQFDSSRNVWFRYIQPQTVCTSTGCYVVK